VTGREAQLEGQALSSDAPEWIHLLNPGENHARDGRKFILANADEVVATFYAEKLDLAVDFEHQTKKRDQNAVGPVPAAGWIKDLENRQDGIWGRVTWTPQARSLIQEQSYRYISPVLNYGEKDLVVQRITGAGLVHYPALTLTALNSMESDMTAPNPFLHKIAQRLGLADGVSEDEIMKALDDALSKEPDPEKYVPIDAMKSALQAGGAQKKDAALSRIEHKVSEAMRRGFISPAMKDWATALCMQNEVSFDTMINSSTPMFESIVTPSHMANRPPDHFGVNAHPQSDLAASVCSQLGLEPTALND